MRDQKCADIIDRLLEDLEGLLPMGSGEPGVASASDSGASGTTNRGEREDRIRDASNKRPGIGGRMPQASSVAVAGMRGAMYGNGRDLSVSTQKASARQDSTPGQGEGKMGHDLGEGNCRIDFDVDSQTLARQLRSKMLFLREALYRHASFLEFLSAPDTVGHGKVVPSWDTEDGALVDRDEDTLDAEAS